MSEKRMLIVPAELVRKIDENRGDMSQAEFLNYLIDNRLKSSILKSSASAKDGEYVTREALRGFEHGIKDLLRSFLEFVVSYGLELGKAPAEGDLEELSRRLGGMQRSSGRSAKED
jgi:hypothetical protein